MRKMAKRFQAHENAGDKISHFPLDRDKRIGLHSETVAQKMFKIDDLVGMLKRMQGARSNTEFAREVGISKAHLGDIYNGNRTPGPAVLSYLGLAKSIVYEKVS